MTEDLSDEVTYATLPELLRESVAVYGERPLFGTKEAGEWRWVTYAEFAAMVDETHEGLARLGIGRGDRVAVIAPNCLAFAVLAYAAFGHGAAIVAMYESQTDANWEYILRDSAAKALFVTTATRDRVEKFVCGLPGLGAVALLSEVRTEPDSAMPWLRHVNPLPGESYRAAPSDIATIIYTSGTTGEPKGVPLTHANVCANVNAVRGLFPLGPDDRSLSFLPWAHIFGQVVEMHSMLSLGASVAICEGPEHIVANLAEVRPTILFSVPRIYEKIRAGVLRQMESKPGFVRRLFAAGIAAASKRPTATRLTVGERMTLLVADTLLFSKIRRKFGGRLRFAVSGGAALSRDVGTFVDALGIPVYEAYGLTETGCVSTNFPGARRPGSVGHPVDGITVTLDGSKSEQPGHGEIIVRGPGVMAGYLNRPDATAEAIGTYGAFRTGDLGRIDEDGYLYVTGRIKEQYKLANGKYVAPSPIEDRLKMSPFVANAMVHGDNRLYNVALIVPDMSALAAWYNAWGEREGIPNPDMPSMLHQGVVHRLFTEEIEKYSGDFHKYEKIVKVILIAEDFTVENGMLTPTLKLRRRDVMARYGSMIEGLYR